MPSSPQSEAVRVVIQARPLLPFEAAHGAAPTLHLSATPPVVSVSRPLSSDATFSLFDAVYAAETGVQPDGLYDAHVAPLVDGLFSGLNATVFAYGQTSAGKSYTMRHLTTRVTRHLFDRKRRADASANVTIRVGFVEIYRERIRDLVDGTNGPLGVVNVNVRERRAPQRNRRPGSPAPAPTVFLDGAKERCVTEERELLDIIHDGALVRQTASTGMNASSSRSHSIITLTVQQESLPDASTPAQCLVAKLHLVDLAGSERAKRTAVVGDRFTEGVEINKGLFALAKVISTLADNASRKGPGAPKAHVPYRDSKITRILQDSLGGNARTLLVACVSPADTSREETLGTLRYAERAKCIKNKPKVNTEANAVEISDLRAALARSKAEITALTSENERLRRCVGSFTRPRRLSATSAGAADSASTETTTNSVHSTYTDCSHSPKRQTGPVIVTREGDDEVSGLKYRIAELEGMLERANVPVCERASLLRTGKDSEQVVSRSPLGKLKSVGLAALNHVDGSESRKKCEARLRGAHGPRRRQRTGKERATETSTACRRNGVSRPGSCKVPSTLDRGVGAVGSGPRVTRTVSSTVMPNFQRRPQRTRPTTRSFEQYPNDSISRLSDLEEDDREIGCNGRDLDSELMNGLSSNRLDEIRRTFTIRLQQAEADRDSLDKQRIQIQRQMGELQRKHDKEIEDLKFSNQLRIAGMRSKLADVKRIDAERMRLIKLRDGSDAAQKRLASKVKSLEKARDEMEAKVLEANSRGDAARRALSKENRDLTKLERGLRAEIRKREVGKSRQDAIISRLRMENEAMKGRLRQAGRQHIRRANSGITPSSASRTTPC